MYDLHSILIQLKKEDTPLHGVMVRCVRCFYQWLDPTLWEGSALFELWAQELELIYGDLRQRLSPNAKTDAGSLGDRFGFDTPPELPRLLQSIQTFYSVLIKLIAWNTLRGATPEPPLTELLSGRAFVNRGIRNFCGDDWYIWPLDIWDPALETQCEELRACLDAFDTCPEGSTLSPDSFSRIYETVVPPALRHALGEYYTPGWLAERTLQNAVSASGQQAGELRFLDPACGSGSLLLKVEKVLGKDNIERGFYGQEIDLTTYNLCRINMFLHNIEFDKFSIVREDTLLSPQHWDDQPFELIVSNPPFSVPWEGDKNVTLINDPRFAPAGVLAPASKGDMAFIMHSLSWLASNGTAAIVCFPGIMYRGGAEQKIRKYLVDNNYIDCIIQLPSNLFFGTSIATCIMVMKKNKTDNKTLFIDATSECVKVTNNNKLTSENIERIVDVFAKREEMEHFAHLASYEEVSGNDYNLSVSTYVEAEDTREKIDIVKLNAEIKEIVVREQVLRDEIDKIIAEIEVNS